MTSEDITFCSKSDCKNTKCDRNPINIKQVQIDHSYAMFTDCEYFIDKPKHDDGVLAAGEALLHIKEITNGKI